MKSVLNAIDWAQEFIHANIVWSQEEMHRYSTIIKGDLPFDAWFEWYQGRTILSRICN
jgi:hypothetical protein